MLTLLHISDLHFGPAYMSPVGDALLAAAGDLEPDIVIASGDFTQRAKREQFAGARRYLDQLPSVPQVLVPGNHDVPLYRLRERLFDPYHLYREYISRELDTVFRREDVVIVALNSTAPRRAITNGRISSHQLAFCSAVLRDSPPDAVRIVVAHHHFAPAPDYEGGQVMPHSKRALDCFTGLGVELLFGGHLHRAYIGNSLDVYPGKQREHGIIIIQSGTTTSRRGRAREWEKNTFNLVRIGDEVIRITHYMYFDGVCGFAPVSRHIFPRAGQRYLAPPPGNGGSDGHTPTGLADAGWEA